MNMKKIVPGILAAFILMAATTANAGGANWSFSVNLHNGHPTFGIHVGQKRRHVKHYRQRWHKRNHRRNHHRGHKRRHAPVVRYHNYGHRHGHYHHVHKHRGGHRH